MTQTQVGGHMAGWLSFQPLYEQIVRAQPELLRLMTTPSYGGQDWPLQFGIFMAPFHPTGQNPTLALERDLDLIEHLDRLGFDEAWIGEHHSGGYEIIASPEVFIATAAERTKHIRSAPAWCRSPTTTRS